MSKRPASLLALVVLVSLISLGSQGQPTSQRHHSASATRSQKAVIPGHNPPPSPIGFLSAMPILPFADTYSTFPGVVGDFNGDGNKDFASIVLNIGTGV